MAGQIKTEYILSYTNEYDERFIQSFLNQELRNEAYTYLVKADDYVREICVYQVSEEAPSWLRTLAPAYKYSPNEIPFDDVRDDVYRTYYNDGSC